MTFDEAIATAKQRGCRIRDDGSMERRWTVVYSPAAKDFFYINPHTGSDYHFTPNSAQKASTRWRVVEERR